MRSYLYPLLLLLAFWSSPCAAQDSDSFASGPIVLANTEKRPLTAETNDRPYLLYVCLPPNYEQDADKHYPVLYITDGYWDTATVNSMYGNLIYDEAVPEYILVGIGYADPEMNPQTERTLDLSPVEDPAVQEPSGGGDDFLQVIQTEIVPFIDEEYRTADYKVLGGSSYGGLFVLYAMLSDPEFFDAYIAISPHVGYKHRWLFAEESRYRWAGDGERNHTALPTRLFMSAAEKEWPTFFGDILAFDQILQHGKYEDFDYKFRVIDGEKHAGTKPEGYSRGMRYAFQPYLDAHGL